jgi:D-alanyl-D-alanine carboxypeptidase
MRRIRRVFTCGFALCAASVTLVAAPATAGATAAAVPAHSAAATASAAHGQPDSALRSAMLDTLAAGATGMIARVDDGDEVTRIGVGVARLDPRRPIRTSDQVRVGSITKSMVATVTLQMVGEGKLHLGDTVEHWLPGLVPGGDQITLRMLLNHTSGIYNYTNDPDYLPTLVADPYRYWSPRELIAIATAHKPVFAPGTGWSYSNTDYILIGLILQKVTGSPIQTLLDRRVFKPLHLKNTFFATSGRFRGSYAHGYLPPSLSGDGYLDVSNWSPSSGWAAGAVVSNAPDLARFYTALMSGRLLKPWLLRQMTTTVETGVEGFRYGLGIYTMDTPCGAVWGHDGGIVGYVSFAFTDRRGSRSTVVLLPTFPDDAITARLESVLGIAVCVMFRHPVPAAAPGRSAPMVDSVSTN